MSGYSWVARAHNLRAQGWSFRQIADYLGISDERVRYRLDHEFREKEKERNRLKRQGKRTNVCAPTRDRIKALVLDGRSDDEILREVWGDKWLDHQKSLLADVKLARDELEHEPIRWRGPWTISYVRSDGELVYRVGTGHDIPEGSLAAFGFRLGKDGQR